MAINQIFKIKKISEKPLKLLIAKNPALFRDKHYNDVSYRLVVLHAMQYYFVKKIGNKNAKLLLNELLSATQNKDGGYYQRGFVEAYKFTKKNKTGLVIIDRSKGCYPLILYPDDTDPKHGSRVWTFQKMLEDLLLSHTQYDDLLRKNQKWDLPLVDQLRSTFTFPEKKQQDDSFIQEDQA